MFEYVKHVECIGVKYCKIFTFKDTNYLVGSKKYDQKCDITKYGLFLIELDEELNVLKEMGFIELLDYKYLDDITLSAGIRDININDNILYFNIEIKQNVNNKTWYCNNTLFSTTNLIDFKMVKKYNVTDFLTKEFTYKNDHYLCSSKIEQDRDNPEFFWGIYLFNIIKNDNSIRPHFDAIVDYNKDKGHLIHNMVYNSLLCTYTMYFSIRHMVDKSIDSSGFMYKLYQATTKDLIHYYDTEEIIFINKDLTCKWYSYPHYFTYKDEEYIVCNQDDYGKNKLPVIFKKKLTLEEFVSKLYNFTNPEKLHFTTDLNYIFYNELANKSGKRYEQIKQDNLDIASYTSYAPSCIELYTTIQKLNVNSNDSILDIGSGRGYALTIFHKFPFKKITGIEINDEDVEISKQNLDILDLKSINIIHDDIFNFTEWDNYNYFYFYNPFSCEFLSKIIENIKINSVLIYKNIHQDEINILLNNNFKFISELPGEERNYFIFTKL